MFKASRRDLVLSAGGAALVFGLNRAVAFTGVAQAQPPNGVVQYRIGDTEVFSLSDGGVQRTVDDLILNAPIEQVRDALALNGVAQGSYTNPFTVTAIRRGGNIVLFDTGLGATGPGTTGRLLANLAAANLDAAQVSTVVISHFHPDHVGGLWMKDASTQVFPNAEILVPEVELRYWTDPSVMSRLPASYINPGITAMVQRIQATFPGWTNMRPYQPGTEVVSGVRAVSTPGHTPGHTSFLLTSGSQQLFIQSDVTGFDRLFVRNPGWQSRVDMDGPLAERTRRAFFERVIAEGGRIAGYHFSFPSTGTLARDGGAYSFVPLAT